MNEWEAKLFRLMEQTTKILEFVGYHDRGGAAVTVRIAEKLAPEVMGLIRELSPTVDPATGQIVWPGRPAGG